MAFYNSINDGNNFAISFTPNPQQDFGVFAKGYTRAASVLAEHLLGKSRFSDYEAYPVVFLYRQAFELYLKGFYYKAGLISFFKGSQSIDYQFVFKHWLKPLAETFQKICKVFFPSDQELLQLADKVYKWAVEFEQIDSDSFGYRYPIDTNGNPSTSHAQVVNLLALHNSMNELLGALEIVDFGFDIEASQAQEIYEIIQEAQTKIASENGSPAPSATNANRSAKKEITMTDNSCELYRNYTEDDIAHIAQTYHPVGTYRLICEIFGASYTIEGCVAFLKRYTINDSKRLDDALALLTNQERQILEHRFGLHDSRAFYDTLQSIGDSFRLTSERIRQIEAKALRKMRHPARSQRIEDFLPQLTSEDENTV